MVVTNVMKTRRLTIVVLDGLGAGKAPDSHMYGDENANTLSLLCEGSPPNRLLDSMRGLTTDVNVTCRLLKPNLVGKGTTTGHWDMFGMTDSVELAPMISDWPSEFVDLVRKICGSNTLCCAFNENGTNLVSEIGSRASQRSAIIAYSSADSIVQLAACETNVGLNRLRFCGRELAKYLPGKFGLGRVITRPYAINVQGCAARTANRMDFHAVPPGGSVFGTLMAGSVSTTFYGKAKEIFHWFEAGKFDGTSEPMAALDSCLLNGLSSSENNTDRKELHLVNFRKIDDLLHEGKLTAAREVFAEVVSKLEAASKLSGIDSALLVTADHGCDIRINRNENTREVVPAYFVGGPQKAHKTLERGTKLNSISHVTTSFFL